jgi:tetratricopeptide (TPR) repeat protein
MKKICLLFLMASASTQTFAMKKPEEKGAQSHPEGGNKGKSLQVSPENPDQVAMDKAYHIGMTFLVEKEFSRAHDCFLSPAMLNHPQSQLQIGLMGLKGQSAMHEERAIQYLQGCPLAEAQYQLGLHFLSRLEYTKAMTCFSEASAQEHGDATFHIAALREQMLNNPDNPLWAEAKRKSDKALDNEPLSVEEHYKSAYSLGSVKAC